MPAPHIGKPGERTLPALLGKVLLVALALGAAFWIFDAIVDAAILGEGDVLRQIVSPEPTEIWVRSAVFSLLVITALYAQRLLSERDAAVRALAERARRDSLTGTFNHGAITEELDQRCASLAEHPDSHVAVLVVDLDSLKSSNDTHGHQVGDDMLLALASALSRDGAIVGRYGGDEFLVVLPDADRQAAERYGEMVRVELANLQLTDPDTGSRVPVMASLGLAICPDDAQSARDLIRIADQGMYASRATRDAAQSPNAA